MPESGSSDPARNLYESCVREHTQGLYRLAYRLTGKADMAEDLLQETFTEAWRSMDGLRQKESARQWLLGILRHRYLHWLRDSGRRPREEIGLDEVDEPRAVAPIQEVDEGISDTLQRGLDQLDERFREPFLLVFLHGLSCRETAQALEVPLGTVLSRLHRARQFLRHALAGDIGQSAESGRLVNLSNGRHSA